MDIMTKKGTTLHIQYINNKRAMAYCPWHDDKNASLEITLSGEYEGKFYCHGCGKSGELVQFILDKLKSKKHKDAVDERVVTVDWEAITASYNTSFYNMSPKKYPFPLKNTVLYNLIPVGWDGEAWTFPERNGKEEIIGILRRFPDGFKTMVDGSRRGLSISDCPLYLPIFITEGVSDMATVLDLGLYAIARPNDDTGSDQINEWLKSMQETEPDFTWNKQEDIYIIADNDEPGIGGAIKLANNLDIPDDHIIIPYHKDIREQCKMMGHEDTQQWLKERII